MEFEVYRRPDFVKSTLCVFVISSLFITAGLLTLKFFPAAGETPAVDETTVNAHPASIFVNDVSYESEEADALPVVWLGKEAFNAPRYDGIKKNTGVDKGLELYRNPATRASVEWFYLRVTGRRDVTMAILEAANRENIPFPLAFALAYTESRFNKKAVNSNVNGSIDRGLFQLNNRTFPKLAESDFFAPETSARYGMSHLRFCMNVAGNDLTALAMYNAGVSRVRNDTTPKTTLNYVNKIVSYKNNLETAFAEEVLSYYPESDYAEIVPVVASR